MRLVGHRREDSIGIAELSRAYAAALDQLGIGPGEQRATLTVSVGHGWLSRSTG